MAELASWTKNANNLAWNWPTLVVCWNLLTNVLPIFTLLDEAMLLNARILWPTLNKAIIKLIYKQINTENEFSNVTIFFGNNFKQDWLTLVYMV